MLFRISTCPKIIPKIPWKSKFATKGNEKFYKMFAMAFWSLEFQHFCKMAFSNAEAD